MYTDVEVVENVNEDFLNALALLHSSDEDSAEGLRDMLVAAKEKKKTDESASRRVNKKSDNYSTKLTGIVSDFEDGINDDFKDRNSSFSSSESILDCNSLSPNEMFMTDDSLENEDIPRISIPDETTGDGVVCKICNGDKLGPLILLECQECQDVYHPLCHHPPVIDIDVYDPRIVWRCDRCIGTFDELAEPLIVTLDDGIEASREEATNIPGIRVMEPMGYAKKKLGRTEVTQVSCFGRTRLKLGNHESSLKRISRVTHKNSAIKLRKRVGSRLNINQPSSAK